ncbi:MAG: helix-turn-helix transcriptional regulator, partial [Anaerotignum sp.]|nr:helix-turn-helix transcriptional regulator [Anaerotignum sp.]
MIYKRIRDLREDNDITQKELAEKLNIAKSTLSGYENETSEPSFSTLFKIADIF